MKNIFNILLLSITLNSCGYLNAPRNTITEKHMSGDLSSGCCAFYYIDNDRNICTIDDSCNKFNVGDTITKYRKP